jgi:hypothetical protein
VVQPGLAGLMDGSVSTLAPLFAAALATRQSRDAFLVGLAASVGAGISMGFAEALSDDGSLTGRGHPWARGIIEGGLTAVGGIGHTLPFLIPQFQAALVVAVAVVLIELLTIREAPNANAYAERFVRSMKEECLGRIIPIGEGHFRRAVSEFVAHYHRERNHQGLENALIEGAPVSGGGRGHRQLRLGGLLNFYRRAA